MGAYYKYVKELVIRDCYDVKTTVKFCLKVNHAQYMQTARDFKEIKLNKTTNFKKHFLREAILSVKQN